MCPEVQNHSCVQLLTTCAMKFAFDSSPAMLLLFGMAYSNQCVAEIMALQGQSRARPKHIKQKIPMPTNLPPPMPAVAEAEAESAVMVVVCSSVVPLSLQNIQMMMSPTPTANLPLLMFRIQNCPLPSPLQIAKSVSRYLHALERYVCAPLGIGCIRLDRRIQSRTSRAFLLPKPEFGDPAS